MRSDLKMVSSGSMSEDSPPTGRFLARVEYLTPEHREHRFARLRPIYSIDDRPWRQVEDGDTVFPDEGTVFWWHPQTIAANGTLWVITLKSHPSYGTEPQHKDRWQVDTALRPYQAMVLYGVNGPREFRRSLAFRSLTFESQVIARPLVETVGKDGHWIALPESLRLSRQDDRTLVELTTGLEGVIPVYEVDAESFEQIFVDGQQYLLLLDPGQPTGYQCALSDAQLIENLRKRISSIDPEALKGIDVTKKLLRGYAEAIEAAGLESDDAAKEEARLDAATVLIEDWDTEVAHINDIVGDLMKHPRIEKDLRIRFEAELKRRMKESERELEQERQADIASLTTRKKEIETAKQELSTLRASISKAVEDILEAPRDALVKHGLLDALKNALHIEAIHSSSAMAVRESTDAIETITEVDRLNPAATAWSHGTGMDTYMMQVALVAVLAHRITLFSGANAERLAIAVASTLAGDNAVRVFVGTAVFGLADLMNAPASPIGSTCLDRIVTLGDFLSERTHQDPMVVILSGCNRAPPEVVLPEFLMMLGDDPQLIGWPSKATGITMAKLSPRIRIIGTLYRGDATYRISPELSRQLGFVPADRRELNVTMPASPIPSPSRIALALWDSLQEPVDGIDIHAYVRWLREVGAGLPPDMIVYVLNTYLRLINDPTKALAEASAGLLLGRDPAPDLSNLPETNGGSIRQLLGELSATDAWQDAVHYFLMGDTR